MANIVFVDEHDNVIGAGSKEEAREKGIPHRIARIFLRNTKGEILIAKRAMTVSFLPGRWGESVAGHVDEGENYIETAKREMYEELGIQNVLLTESGNFYFEMIDSGKTAKRFNSIFLGIYDGKIDFNKDEVSEIRWMLPNELFEEIQQSPDTFTPGCVKALEVLRPTLLSN